MGRVYEEIRSLKIISEDFVLSWGLAIEFFKLYYLFGELKGLLRILSPSM